MEVRETAATAAQEQFCHEAFFYAGDDRFLAGALPFLKEGIRAGDPMLVALDRRKIELLRSELGGEADRVRFADMRELGQNPARIIPAWHKFVADNASAGYLRGIGEPIWAGRSPAEVVECQHHEALLNTAFDGGRPWALLCPYDAEALPAEVVEKAHHSHPTVGDGGDRAPSTRYVDPASARVPFTGTLSPAPPEAPAIRFDTLHLSALRHSVERRARRAGLGSSRTMDLVLAVNEVATNSVRHGGGAGTLTLWRDEDMVLCDIRDTGRFSEPLIGRVQPTPEPGGGYGLWVVNQVCDLVQIRSGDDGNVVRLHMRAD